MFLQVTVNPIMHHLPLPGKDDVVLQDYILDPVHGQQHLLIVLLGIHLDLTDLGPMGSPLLLCVVNLEKNVSRATKRPYVHFSHPGFQFHNPG